MRRNEILIDECYRSEHSGLGCHSLSCVTHFWCVKNQSISHVLILLVLSRACQCTIHLPSIWCMRWKLSAFSTILYTSTCNWNTLNAVVQLPDQWSLRTLYGSDPPCSVTLEASGPLFETILLSIPLSHFKLFFKDCKISLRSCGTLSWDVEGMGTCCSWK